MLKAHRIRLNPTPQQQEHFMRAAGIARFTWNWALAEYHESHQRGETANWNSLSARFNSIKHSEFPFVTEVSKCVASNAISDLRQAFNTRFKTKKTRPSMVISQPSFRKRSKRIGGFGIDNQYFSISGHTVKVPKLGDVNMSQPLRFVGKIMSGRITEKAGYWYLSVVIETQSPPSRGLQGSVGVDFGLRKFATLSTGEVYETQGFFHRGARKITALQRGLERKTKGSNRRERWRLRLSRAHEHIRAQRSNFLHQFSHALASRFEVICIEDLNLLGLRQSRLSRSVIDAGIGRGIQQLAYKTDWHGSALQKVGMFFPSSKLCSACGHRNGDLGFSDYKWTCPTCGAFHDRDANASLNIELEGLRLLAGSGYVGVTPVDGKALACASALAKPRPGEAGTFFGKIANVFVSGSKRSEYLGFQGQMIA